MVKRVSTGALPSQYRTREQYGWCGVDYDPEAIKPYEWKFKGKSGVSPSLDRLVVTELEVYDDADADVEVFDLDEAL